MDFDFETGIYRLNLVKAPASGVEWGYIALEDIVDDPEDSFDSFAKFPTQFRLNQKCKVYATLDATVYEEYEDNMWEVSITKLG